MMNDTARQAELEEAERLADELVAQIGDPQSPLMAPALVMRGEARRRLGRDEEAQADLATARQLAPRDSDALRAAAAAKLEAGDVAAALELLRDPLVQNNPLLLAMRASAFVVVGDAEHARTDLDAAVRAAPDASAPDIVRLMSADVALDLGDRELSAALLETISDETRGTAQYAVMQGRLALKLGDLDAGSRHFAAAAERDPDRRAAYFIELGVRLLGANRAEEAVAAFDAAGGASGLPEQALQPFASAAFAASDLAKAQESVDRALSGVEIPVWALAMATNIALRQEDNDAAVRHLSQLIDVGVATAQVRIEIAKALIESGREDEASEHLTALEGLELDPVEQMQYAQLLRAAGDEAESLPIAFAAYRRAPQDPRISRAFASLVLTARSGISVTDVVESGVRVTLRDSAGRTFGRTVLADGPIDPLREEISSDDAEQLGLLGKRVGEAVIRGEAWREETWTVVAITPAIAYAAHDVVSHYEERFPNEPFFAASIHMGDGSSVRDFAPLIGSLAERRDFVQRVLAQYQDQILPLGVVSQMVGVAIPELMESLSANTANTGPLLVEWASQPDQDGSRAAALRHDKLVLTRSSLKTALDLGLLDAIRSGWSVFAARTLWHQLRTELADAQRALTEGVSTMVGTEAGPRIDDVPAGHPALEERAEKTSAALAWLQANADIQSRPVDTINPAGSVSEEVRSTMGAQSYDSVVLAEHLEAALYADDLGLRRFAPHDRPAASVSTLTLLDALRSRELITAEAHHDMELELVSRGYAFVRPTTDLLVHIVSRADDPGREKTRAAFALLGGPHVTLPEASDLAAQVLREIGSLPVQTMSATQVSNLAMFGMAQRWPRALVAQALVNAAQRHLPLMPTQLEQITEAASSFSSGNPLIR
jgi:tetratricopeptide (TPR) repeat protein